MYFTSPETQLSALLVGEFEDDRALVRDVFTSLGWRLFEAANRKSALDCLQRHSVHVVIARTGMPDWNWRRALAELNDLAHPPLLIVTAHIADESLWAEVLNLGGYDVMSQPFDRYEIERVIASAHRRYFAPLLRAPAPSDRPPAQALRVAAIRA